ncbi:MAG: hypothetical protein PWP70_1122 [Moorella sp. (in: firmicutes)]|nr:hypothetical protein [Moorella sp. (in: firmicutes)]
MVFKFSRRSFLKGVGMGTAALAIGGVKSIDVAAAGTTDSSSPIKRFRNVCPRNCHDTCGMITEVQDGKVIRITGDPDHPITRGALCLKGATYVRQIYAPDRQLYPLKRVGKKGEGKWQRISWDEALATIADKFKAIIASDGGEAILPYWYSGTLGAVTDYSMNYRFFYRLGASQLEQSVCASAGVKGCQYTFGTTEGMDPEDFVNSKLVISWGVNEQATNVHAFLKYNEAFAKGAEYVVVNPRRIEGAQMADLFIQPRPGTDAALALGMMNVIIAEGLYDADYVSKYTIGFEQLKTRVAEYPPDKASEITGVPREQIIEFARLYAQTKPAALRVGFGIQRNSNGGMTVRTITCLPALCGQWGRHGGGLLYINDQWPWNFTKLFHFPAPKTRTINMNRLGEALLEAHPPIKALYVYNSNPAGQCPNLNRVFAGLKREDLFTVVHDLFLTDTADYADIFLPATHFLEQWDFHQAYWGWIVEVNEKAVDPAGEARSNDQVFRDLARAMGFNDPCFNDQPEDIIRQALETDSPRFQGITFERLLKEGPLHLNTPEIPFVCFQDGKFPTPSGKIEFYSEQMQKDGFDPLPAYVPPAESKDGSPELYAKYPIVLLTAATKNLLSTQWSNDPRLQEIEPLRSIEINPEDAGQRGIKSGDQVIVKNDRGSVQLVAVVTDTVKPGVAFSPKAPWPKLSPDGKNINFLTADRLADMGHNSTYHTNLVQITKA